MSEYHDTNEDERDWKWERECRWQEGRTIRQDAEAGGLRPAMIVRLRHHVSDSSMLAGFDLLPFPG